MSDVLQLATLAVKSNGGEEGGGDGGVDVDGGSVEGCDGDGVNCGECFK